MPESDRRILLGKQAGCLYINAAGAGAGSRTPASTLEEWRAAVTSHRLEPGVGLKPTRLRLQGAAAPLGTGWMGLQESNPHAQFQRLLSYP